jgi:hypothetical protein
VEVWVQVLNGVAIVRASRYTVNGTWSGPMTISSAAESVDDGVVLGVDDAGNAVAVWTGAAGGVPTLRATQHTEVTDTWSAPVGVAPAGRAPSVVRLAVDRVGTAAFVAYRGFDGARDLVRAVRHDAASGTWSAPVDLSTSPQQAVDVDIAADEQGRAIPIWSLLNGTVQTARFNGTWSIPSDRAAGAATRDVGIDTDAAGNAVATWTHVDGGLYRVQAAVYAAATNGWEDAEDVSDTTGDAVVHDWRRAERQLLGARLRREHRRPRFSLQRRPRHRRPAPTGCAGVERRRHRARHGAAAVDRGPCAGRAGDRIRTPRRLSAGPEQRGGHQPAGRAAQLRRHRDSAGDLLRPRRRAERRGTRRCVERTDSDNPVGVPADRTIARPSSSR